MIFCYCLYQVAAAVTGVAVAYEPMLRGRLVQGIASALGQTPRYRSCSRHRPHLVRYQHRVPPAVFPQHRLDGTGTSRFRCRVGVVCGRFIHYGGQAPRTAARERRNIVLHILANSKTFHRKYSHAAPFIGSVAPHLQLIKNTESTS